MMRSRFRELSPAATQGADAGRKCGQKPQTAQEQVVEEPLDPGQG